jgi:subtilisin family serine protease
MSRQAPRSGNHRSRHARATERWIALLVVSPFLLAATPGSKPVSSPSRTGWMLGAGPDASTRYVPGRLYVKLRSRLDGPLKTSPALRQLLGSGLDTARPFVRGHAAHGPLAGGVDRLYTMEVPVDTDIPWVAAKLSRLPEVEYAEPAYVYEVVGESTPPGLEAVPNDPDYPGMQPYLTVMQVATAWNFAKGSDTSPVVCVVDGGTNWHHEDLLANMWSNPGEIAGNSIDDDGNGYVDDVHGWNFQYDNGDPRGDFTNTPSLANHGTHTGGLLAAVTNNGIHIASASWNPRLMAVNASGMDDGDISFGYEGVVYAADNGASIVSLSWGGTGGSQAGQDVIDYAVAQGMLVVAAAGNHGSDTPFFPAAYRNVIAVANVWGNDPNGIGTLPDVDSRYGTGSASAYGGWVDVAAAGVGIYSTFDFGSNNSYGSATGTSMSSPVAAAVAALIKSKHPTWDGLKVGEQLRITCDNINAVNPGFADLLGMGRVNALRAVTETHPGVRITDWTLTDANGNGELNRGESVTVSITAHNYLAGVTGLNFTLSSPSPYISIVDGSQAAGSLAENATASYSGAFTFTVAANAPAGTELNLRVDMAGSPSYTDFQWIPILLEPIVKTHDINNVHVSLASSGNIGWIGFPGGLGGEKGQGFRFQGGPNVLFEGALMLGTSSSNLSDAARTFDEHTDFSPAGDQPPTKSTPGASSDQEIRAPFVDNLNVTAPLGVRVDLQSRAFASPPNDDFVFLGYKVRNTSAGTLVGLRLGLFFDWDIDETHYATNQAAWDPSRKLGYAWDSSQGTLPYVGVMTFSGGPQVAYSAIRNDGNGSTVNLYDGSFTKVEKWSVLNGTGVQAAGPTDISNALAVGPYTLAVNDSVTVWFALLGGTSLADLQGNADRAIQVFGDSILTAIGDPLPEVGDVPRPRLRLGEPTPNPFNPGTRVELVVDRPRQLAVGVYDTRGRLIRMLLDRSQPAGVIQVVWDGRNDQGHAVPSGIYFIRLYSERELLVKRAVLAK